jgi:hypothetical protein
MLERQLRSIDQYRRRQSPKGLLSGLQDRRGRSIRYPFATNEAVGHSQRLFRNCGDVRCRRASFQEALWITGGKFGNGSRHIRRVGAIPHNHIQDRAAIQHDSHGASALRRYNAPNYWVRLQALYYSNELGKQVRIFASALRLRSTLAEESRKTLANAIPCPRKTNDIRRNDGIQRNASDAVRVIAYQR